MTAPDVTTAVERVIRDVDGVQRTVAGESVLGYRVAAWRYHGHFDNPAHGFRYCDHWSTPGKGAVNVERLFTETQLRTILSELDRLSAALGEAERRNIVLAMKALVDRVDSALVRNQWPDARDLETLEQVAAWWTDHPARNRARTDADGTLVATCQISDQCTEETQDKYEREKERRARLIAAAPDLLSGLIMEVKNCPLCKGDGVTDQTLEHLVELNGKRAGVKTDCPRCKPSRDIIARATQPGEV